MMWVRVFNMYLQQIKIISKFLTAENKRYEFMIRRFKVVRTSAYILIQLIQGQKTIEE